MNCNATLTTCTVTDDVVATRTKFWEWVHPDTPTIYHIPDGVAVARDGDRLLRLERHTLTCDGEAGTHGGNHWYQTSDLRLVEWSDGVEGATPATPPADGHEHEWGVWHRVTDAPDGWDHFTRQCLATVECPAMQKGRMVPDRPAVTDAQVEAALAEFYPNQTRPAARKRMRAALEVAAEVRPEPAVTATDAMLPAQGPAAAEGVVAIYTDGAHGPGWYYATGDVHYSISTEGLTIEQF